MYPFDFSWDSVKVWRTKVYGVGYRNQLVSIPRVFCGEALIAELTVCQWMEKTIADKRRSGHVTGTWPLTIQSIYKDFLPNCICYWWKIGIENNFKSVLSVQWQTSKDCYSSNNQKFRVWWLADLSRIAGPKFDLTSKNLTQNSIM